MTAPDGSALDTIPAVGSGEGYQVSVLASASPELHERLLAAVADGMVRLGAELG